MNIDASFELLPFDNYTINMNVIAYLCDEDDIVAMIKSNSSSLWKHCISEMKLPTRPFTDRLLRHTRSVADARFLVKSLPLSKEDFLYAFKCMCALGILPLVKYWSNVCDLNYRDAIVGIILCMETSGSDQVIQYLSKKYKLKSCSIRKLRKKRR